MTDVPDLLGPDTPAWEDSIGEVVFTRTLPIDSLRQPQEFQIVVQVVLLEFNVSLSQ